MGSVWATYHWVKWKAWVVPSISRFQQCWSFSGCWMPADLNVQHLHLPVLCWLNVSRRVWRCHRWKLAIGELIISYISAQDYSLPASTNLFKGYSLWVSHIFSHFVAQTLMVFVLNYLFKDVFIVNSLERHSVTLQSRRQFCLLSRLIISPFRAHIRQVCF